MILSGTRVFAGGGGGAGDGNNDASESGANGGGLIFLITDNLAGSGNIIANGDAARDTRNGGNDAPGGGGSGGSIVLVANNSSGVALIANGGNGGNQIISSSENEGPGGGSVDFPLEADTDYSIRFEKKGFFAKNGMFSTVNMMPGVIEINKYVDLEFEAIELGKAIKIENIYYDYDKSFIRADAAIELDKIVALLIENPSIKIEMGSHTDARGSDSYNLKLSDRRAKAAMEYLVKKGIARNRVTYKGYGETVLINDCANGTERSDEKHQENRRTEFKVIGFL
ncbi:MAG: OmpA family protein [Flavobacteriales bacterium]|nr:OmpA family protein [Flavobacteriales bacterium]MDG1765449.1 OmpA family protein [Flavobacteriales bacterium]